MGSKHDKKRFLIVKYSLNKQGKYDELVELSKKRLGAGKIAEAKVILDLENKEVIKCDFVDMPRDSTPPYEHIYNHYYKWYGNVIDQFLAS